MKLTTRITYEMADARGRERIRTMPRACIEEWDSRSRRTEYLRYTTQLHVESTIPNRPPSTVHADAALIPTDVGGSLKSDGRRITNRPFSAGLDSTV